MEIIENIITDNILKSKQCENNIENNEKSLEKGSIEMKGKEKNDEIKEINFSKPNDLKPFDYDTLNRDLADIEERLRQTRLSWHKDGTTTTGAATIDLLSKNIDVKDSSKKSWSMLDIDRRTYSSTSSTVDIEKYDGRKETCESPALSEGLLKWDYGADIGLNQDESDDMEPITWPVTAEEAQKNERDAINRQMKQSLSQGSFLASPDPEDRHNIINRFSEEYKSRKSFSSQNLVNHRQYNSVSTLSLGKYDEESARQIMEQAEAAEKRLRDRLEVVKAIHLNGKSISRDVHENEEKPDVSEHGISNVTPSRKLSDVSSNHEKSDCIIDTTRALQDQLIEDFTLDNNKSNAMDDRSKSPNSISHTGRTTTIESTHTFSDYAKAPIFQPEAYGSRTEYTSTDTGNNMYSKRNKDKSFEKGRMICGIAPELDTISSRETLHITDEKKENSAVSAYSQHEDNSPVQQSLKDTSIKDPNRASYNFHLEIPPEDSVQAKWDRFKSMRKDDEYEQLHEKTTVRNAATYHPQNSHRQLSSATTFTTITNVSPRYDSFATETFKSPIRDAGQRDFIRDNQDAVSETRSKRYPGKVQSNDEERKEEYRRSDTNHGRNSRSRPGRRIVGGAGAGKDDDDDDDNDISQTEKRRMRHASRLRKLKKRFGSGQLDGETTASELEHDDVVQYRQNSDERGSRCEQLSKMLTKLSRRGVTKDPTLDVSDHGDSTSVDTVQLMNRMSNLLGKQYNVARRRNNSKQSKEKISRKESIDSTHYPNKRPSNVIKRITESEDGMLVLKHLMLKQKVKLLADCAREEARRRKVKKLQKLIEMYEQGDRVIVPSDLETDTATLMGSDRGSQNDLDSQIESFTHGDDDDLTPTDYKVTPSFGEDQLTKGGSHSLRQKYYDSRNKEEKKQHYIDVQEKQSTKNKKTYPASESWNVPLRDGHYNCQEDFNSSNLCKPPKQRYRSPCSRAESVRQENPVNLSAKERVRIKYELEMARQRNAHECQKDVRHSRTGNTKVNGGGLSWTISTAFSDKNDSDYRSGNKHVDSHLGENVKDKGSMKSDLQFAFEQSMESFISRSRQRQKRIKLASDERRYDSQMNMERERLFVTSGAVTGVPKRRSITRPDPLSENLYKPRRRKFSKTEMKIQSARKYETLPEVQAKYIDERRKARIQNNRMRMQLYGEKILQTLLRNRAPWVTEVR